MLDSKYSSLGMDIQSVFNCACILALWGKDTIWEQRHLKKNGCPVLSLKGVAEMLSDRCGGQDHNEFS